jgi:iron complex outermembrane receptor protein
VGARRRLGAAFDAAAEAHFDAAAAPHDVDPSREDVRVWEREPFGRLARVSVVYSAPDARGGACGTKRRAQLQSYSTTTKGVWGMCIRQVAGACLIVLACTSIAIAQQQEPQTPAQGAQGPGTQGQAPAGEPVDAAQASPVYEEQVVVSASKNEEALVNAPAAVSLINSQTIINTASSSYADVFRSVPGVNVTQTSARDINITSRGATSTLSTSQLALVDGRSIYLDFFGFIAWDFLPVNPAEIKQIEVIRGPASAIWGANALTGVVNVITKTPRENQGSSFTVGFGGFNRESSRSSQGAGSLFYVSGSHAQAVSDLWSYKVSAGVFTQDPLLRPTGAIPNDTGTQYPGFTNTGTTQPKFDLRVDRDFDDGRRLVFQGGVAGTDGILHSGIGPFDIDSGTVLSYAKVNYSKGAFKANFFTNILDGSATNLLAFGPTGEQLGFDFKSKTFDFELGNVQNVGTHNVLTYGGNFRQNLYDLTIAPEADNRTEGGAYVQDEIFLGKHVRWIVGARVDKFQNIDNPQFSPRTSLMLKPSEQQTIRVSYNRAFRAPSVINNYLDTVILNQLPLGPPGQAPSSVFTFPVVARGNKVEIPGVESQELTEQSITAYEVGYTGIIADRATVTAAWFQNETKNDVFFSQVGSYRAANPPPGWPLSPIVLELLYCPPNAPAGRTCPFGAGFGLPSAFSYREFGRVRQRGVEFGVDGAFTKELSAFANYSYQPNPRAIDFPQSEINLPPEHRVNLGVNYSGSRLLGNLAVSYQDEAYWQDVLDARYAGTTDAYTQVNLTAGVKFGTRTRTRDQYVLALKIVNLFNEEIQQHIFGDIFKRQIAGELRVSF